MSFKTIRHLGLVLSLLLVSQFLAADEHFSYKASYRGVLSLFSLLDIGDVDFRVSPLQAGTHGEIQHLQLAVSSAAYPTVEKLYPYRYQFDSIFNTEDRQTHLFENLKKTKKLKHSLAYLDFSKDQVQLYHVGQNEQVLDNGFVTRLLASGHLDGNAIELTPAAKALTAIPQHTLDRLSLLQDIRNNKLTSGNGREYDITNGDELMHYRYRVEKQEPLSIQNRTIQAWKVRIDAYEVNPAVTQIDVLAGDSFLNTGQSQEKLLHAPVYVWISADARRVPLKFVNHHALGQFIIELKNPELLGLN